VPAYTVSPSLNFARAKSLASISVSNLLVARGLRLRGNTPRFCTSKVTYQVYGICRPGMTRRDLPNVRWPPPMFAAARSPHADRAQRQVLVARWVGIVSAVWGASVSSVGGSADGGGPDAYRHATTYGCATINTSAICASAMNASVMNASAANAGAPTATAICEGIS
jgi:hypothetical protein